MPDFFKIGIIIGAHGVKGDARVMPCTFDINRFKLLDAVTVETEKIKISLKIEGARFHKQFVILKFFGIDTIDDTLKLKGGGLYIPRAAALPLAEDEYYTADLYDMRAVTDAGEELGVITEIIATGANDVYVISKPGQKDLLIPAIKKCVLSVDVAGRVMTIHLMEGLR